MPMTPKGFVLTSEYQEVLPESDFHVVSEFINYGSETVFILFGGATEDSDAIEIPVADSWFSQYPIGSAVMAKGNGKLVVVAANQD